MAIALLRVEGGQYTSDTLDDDLQAYITDVNKDLSTFSRKSYYLYLWINFWGIKSVVGKKVW